MLILRTLDEVQRYERFCLIGTETPENEGESFRLLNEVCEAVFGVTYNSLPDWFFEEPEPWINSIDHRAWTAKRGYDVTDEDGRLLNCAEVVGYVIEAIERGIVAQNKALIAKYRGQAWELALEEAARRFRSRSR